MRKTWEEERNREGGRKAARKAWEGGRKQGGRKEKSKGCRLAGRNGSGGGEGEEGRRSERTKRNTKRKRKKDAMLKEEIDGRTTKKLLPSDIVLSSSSGSRSSSLSCIDACSSDDVLESAPRRKRNWAKVL